MHACVPLKIFCALLSAVYLNAGRIQAIQNRYFTLTLFLNALIL